MKRRAALATLLGNRTQREHALKNKHSLSVSAAANLTNMGLTPYMGPWEYEQAAHLLRRATFGPTQTTIQEAVALGMDATIEQLFMEQELPAPPINYYFTEDPDIRVGETWVDAPTVQDGANGYRDRSLEAWTFGNILNEGISIREKMTLFWHNHFSVADVKDVRFKYRYITTLRENAIGNIRDLIKKITLDPAMLRFLNGNQNTEKAPNENFARELLELYTVGKGAFAGPGDYTTFTEQDVVEMARVLTGWDEEGHNSKDPEKPIRVFFDPEKHDTASKQLSPRFGSLVISDMGDQEYDHLIDIIFNQDVVAFHISRKLYRWFIYYKIDQQIEDTIIAPMAQLLIDNNYDIQPVLRALLSSEHFFDILSRGPMIKSPIDFAISSIKQLEVSYPEEVEDMYDSWWRSLRKVRDMGMEYYRPPEVAGWKAWYQGPTYYRFWIDAITLKSRMGYTNTLADRGHNFNGFRLKVDPLHVATLVSAPLDPNILIDELAQLLFPMPILDNQKVALKEILIPGLPDFEWTVEYGDYLADPENAEIAEAVSTKLQKLIQALLQMPEFYLS